MFLLLLAEELGIPFDLFFVVGGRFVPVFYEAASVFANAGRRVVVRGVAVIGVNWVSECVLRRGY